MRGMATMQMSMYLASEQSTHIPPPPASTQSPTHGMEILEESLYLFVAACLLR